MITGHIVAMQDQSPRSPVLKQVVHDGIAPVFMIEVDIEAPVHQPRALLHLLEHRREAVAVDRLFQLQELIQRIVPFLSRSQKAPRVGGSATIQAGCRKDPPKPGHRT